MAKLVLKFDDRVLQESAIGSQGVRIGRSPDNTLVIDNPAVSSRHARVVRDGGSFVLEDLNSTNGTFVNEKRVIRHTLHDGDRVLIGKHTIEFDLLADEPVEPEPEAGPAVPDLGGTRLLDTEHHKALLAKWEKEAQGKQAPTGTTPAATAASVSPVPKTERPTAPARIGVLRVLAGRTDGSEYKLSGHTSLIGKADTSLVRLKGWFKPNVAVAIARKGDDYAATALGGKTLINGQRLSGRQDLKDGDVLEVSGITLEFRLR
jgi:predicted component of type VI protein secretion system